MTSAVAPGYVLAEKYRLLDCIGRGGMGEVWRALHLSLDSEVAVKFINADLTGSDAVLSRFVREARAAAALRSPHVVQILDYGVDGKLAYMVMELLQGESLGDRFTREHVPPAELARILTHVARALTKAHEAGIVHRDLKPDNVFLTFADDELIAKVLDFGVAKVRVPQNMDAATRTGALLGTPYYMSPEQAEGNRDVDHRSDIWAMGVIAFEGLTGKRPFDSDAFGNLLLKICTHPIVIPSEVASVPPGFDEWFATAVNRDVTKRFQSAKQAAEALVRVCDGTGAARSAPTPPSESASDATAAPAVTGTNALASTNQALARTLDPASRRSLLLPVAGVVGAAALAAGAYFALRGPTPAAAPADSVAAEAPSAPALVQPATARPAAPSEPTVSVGSSAPIPPPSASAPRAVAAKPAPPPKALAVPALPKPPTVPTPKVAKPKVPGVNSPEDLL